mmetsp:Transcript_3478/g.9333  ORF Transcript_3478/g.9333 Transcript_3478/m.9333 type:complete len:229 (+) Transcript_3478:81-767(+)
MAPLAARRGALPRRAAHGDAALWRYVGMLGRAWRLHSKDVPDTLREQHVVLLLAARDLLLPHVGGGQEAGDLLDMLAALAGRPVTRAVAAPAVTPGAVGVAAPATPQPSMRKKTTRTPPKQREKEPQEDKAILSKIQAPNCEKPALTEQRTALKSRMRCLVRDKLPQRGLVLRDDLVAVAMEVVEDGFSFSIGIAEDEFKRHYDEFYEDAKAVVGESIAEFAAWWASE